MAGAEVKPFPRPCATPSIAAPSGSKARMSEHRDVRVRAGPLGAKCDGRSSQPDVGSTVMSGANGFGHVCRNKSGSLACERNRSSEHVPLDPEMRKDLARDFFD